MSTYFLSLMIFKLSHFTLINLQNNEYVIDYIKKFGETQN